MGKEQAASFQQVDVVVPAISHPIPWGQAQRLLREIEDDLRLAPGNGPGGEAPLRLLVERLPAILEVLRQAHEELNTRVTEAKQITAIAQAERCLAAEHAVARILAESARLTDAAWKILQGISQSLGWDVGALWTLDRDAEVLECIEVWHGPTVVIPTFERVSRQCTFAPGIGLPGHVWASGGPVWIPDLVQDADPPRAPIAAKEGLHAAVGFPLRNGNDFLGVMEFFSLEIRQPDEELLQMMTSIGRHISQLIERLKAENTLFRQEQ